MLKPKFVSIHQGTAHGEITLPEERRLIESRRRNFYIEIWSNDSTNPSTPFSWSMHTTEFLQLCYDVYICTVISILTNSYMQSFHTRFLSALFTMYTSFEVPTQHTYSIDICIDIIICTGIQDQRYELRIRFIKVSWVSVKQRKVIILNLSCLQRYIPSNWSFFS